MLFQMLCFVFLLRVKFPRCLHSRSYFYPIFRLVSTSSYIIIQLQAYHVEREARATLRLSETHKCHKEALYSVRHGATRAREHSEYNRYHGVTLAYL